jgi:transposase-like protein
LFVESRASRIQTAHVDLIRHGGCAPWTLLLSFSLMGQGSLWASWLTDSFSIWHRILSIMANALFTEPRFNDDDAAREHLESLRWPDGPVCPHCGGADRQSKLEGKSHRAGLHFCGHCRSQYTVTVGSVFERSKVPLHKWVLATHLICSSKKGMSSHQLHRTLGVTYKTAWFMSHRIREAMNIEPEGQLGGGSDGSGGGVVEVDETFWGNNGKHAPGARSYHHKMKIVSLVDRAGEKEPVRNFVCEA